jgi:hypothetical protein
MLGYSYLKKWQSPWAPLVFMQNSRPDSLREAEGIGPAFQILGFSIDFCYGLQT